MHKLLKNSYFIFSLLFLRKKQKKNRKKTEKKQNNSKGSIFGVDNFYDDTNNRLWIRAVFYIHSSPLQDFF